MWCFELFAWTLYNGIKGLWRGVTLSSRKRSHVGLNCYNLLSLVWPCLPVTMNSWVSSSSSFLRKCYLTSQFPSHISIFFALTDSQGSLSLIHEQFPRWHERFGERPAGKSYGRTQCHRRCHSRPWRGLHRILHCACPRTSSNWSPDNHISPLAFCIGHLKRNWTMPKPRIIWEKL